MSYTEYDLLELCTTCGHQRCFHDIGKGNDVPLGQGYCDDRHSNSTCDCTKFTQVDMKKIKIDLSDPDTRATWDAVIQAKKEVSQMPPWKKGELAEMFREPGCTCIHIENYGALDSATCPIHGEPDESDEMGNFLKSYDAYMRGELSYDNLIKLIPTQQEVLDKIKGKR